MRTTINLPDDLAEIARSLARDQGVSLSEAVARLMREAIGSTGSATVKRGKLSGLPTLHLGHTITSDDVRALDDEP